MIAAGIIESAVCLRYERGNMTITIEGEAFPLGVINANGERATKEMQGLEPAVRLSILQMTKALQQVRQSRYMIQ